MSDKVKEALDPIADFLGIELVGDFGVSWTEVIINRLPEDQEWWANYNQALGIGQAATQIEVLATEYFKAGKDDKAKEYRELSKEFRDLATELDAVNNEHAEEKN